MARLNAAIPDPSYRVTREYLLNGEHYYSHEFNLYANEFAREICGDPQFYYHRGLRSIPSSMIHVARPLSLTQIYRMLPSLVAKVTQTDVRTALAANQSAVLQWHPGRQFEDIPPAPPSPLYAHGLPGLPRGLRVHPPASFRPAAGADQGAALPVAWRPLLRVGVHLGRAQAPLWPGSVGRRGRHRAARGRPTGCG